MKRLFKAMLVGFLASLGYMLYTGWRKRQAQQQFARSKTPYEPLA